MLGFPKHYYWILLLAFVLTWGNAQDWDKGSSKDLLDFLEGDLVIYQGNTLAPMSPLYLPRIKILNGVVGLYDEIFEVKPDPEKIILCESRGDPESCNEKYGCRAGMGLWGFISGTWNETIKRMALENVYMPEHCWQEVHLPISEGRTEIVFDAECNFLAGIWLLKTDGDKHWRPYSGSCYLR